MVSLYSGCGPKVVPKSSEIRGIPGTQNLVYFLQNLMCIGRTLHFFGGLHWALAQDTSLTFSLCIYIPTGNISESWKVQTMAAHSAATAGANGTVSVWTESCDSFIL